MKFEDVKALAELMNKEGLGRLEITENGSKIRLEKYQHNICSDSSSGNIGPAAVGKTENTGAVQDGADGKKDYKEIKSPMVGVFYAAPSPDSDPYVKVGSRVKKGDVLCIVEAMKLLNEINSDMDGEIAEICVENGQVVEYGQTLFKLQ